MSKAFHSRAGKAFLLDECVNVHLGKEEERLMTTGLHTVKDLYCNSCNALLGWRYCSAKEKAQRYKEGKYVLEMSKLLELDRDDLNGD